MQRRATKAFNVFQQEVRKYWNQNQPRYESQVTQYSTDNLAGRGANLFNNSRYRIVHRIDDWFGHSPRTKELVELLRSFTDCLPVVLRLIRKLGKLATETWKNGCDREHHPAKNYNVSKNDCQTARDCYRPTPELSRTPDKFN